MVEKPQLTTTKRQFYGGIAVLTVLACVAISRHGAPTESLAADPIQSISPSIGPGLVELNHNPKKDAAKESIVDDDRLQSPELAALPKSSNTTDSTRP